MSESGSIDIKAKMAGHYRLKLGIFVVALAGMAGWFLYDGMVKYPKQKAVYEDFLQWRAEGKEEKWHAHAKEAFGYTKKDEPHKRTHQDIVVQKLFAGLLGVGALVFGVGYVRSYGKWVSVDDEGIATHTTEKVPFGAITRIDRAKWKSKGIAFLHFEDGPRSGRILLDDWKYDLKPTRAIMVVLEEHVDDSLFEDPEEDANVSHVEPDAFGDETPVDGDDVTTIDADPEDHEQTRPM